MLSASFSILKYELFISNDSYFSQEIITDMLNIYLAESGKVTLKLKASAEAEIKKIITAVHQNNAAMNTSVINNSRIMNNSNEDQNEFDINTLRENTYLIKEDWIKIIELLSKFEYCNEEFFVSYVEKLMKEEEKAMPQQTQKKGQEIRSAAKEIKSCYETIVKTLLMFVEKGNDKVVLSFTDQNPEETMAELYKKKAFCYVPYSQDYSHLLETIDYVKDKKIKKLKIPNMEAELKHGRVYNTTVNHISQINNINYGYTILIEDANAEFFISIKVLECFLKSVINKYEPDLDCKSLFTRFFDSWKVEFEEIRKKFDISNQILSFSIPLHEEDQEDSKQMIDNQDN